MDYNKLKTFVRVAEVGSVTGAARAMRRSQSAITQQIQMLEQDLGMALLERKGGKVLLSSHGEQVCSLAEEHLRRIEEGLLDLKAEVSQVQGTITLGVLNDYGCDMDYGRLLGGFCRNYPNVNFELREGTSESLERALRNNQIDLSFQVYFQEPELVHQIPVQVAWHSLYASPKYLKVHGPIRTYKRLVESHLVDLTEDFICIGTFLRKNAPRLAPSLMHRKPNVAVPNHSVMKEIVVSGFGVAILPDYFVKKELKKGQLVPVMPGGKSVYAGLDLAYRAHKTLRMPERLFIDYVKDTYSGE